jgi:tRNA/rRNA methyltransferase
MSLDRVSIVLVETSHPGNVGATARAMRVMGLSQLRLVAPRFPDIARRDEARAFASGATDVLERATVHPTLDDAIADTVLAVAVSAGGREFAPDATTPEACAEAALDDLAADPAHRVAFVFGSERVGLSIEQAQRCQRLLSIPTAGDYSSLNLAQAVQVVTYCLMRAAAASAGRPDGTHASHASHAPSGGPRAQLAELRSVEGFLAHLERSLVAVGYLDPEHPKKLMPRMRRLFSRARLEQEEVDLLRGVCKMMERAASRADGSGGGSR